MVIEIRRSETADTRSCDVTKVTKEELLKSSVQHIGDVAKGLAFFQQKLSQAIVNHDVDKLTLIDWFYECFKTKFEDTSWWDNHRKIHRHHLTQDDGIPEDVNLIDILEYLTDCVMAGKARNAEGFYKPEAPDELLQRAFQNTVNLLLQEVVVVDTDSISTQQRLTNLRAYLQSEHNMGGGVLEKIEEGINR